MFLNQEFWVSIVTSPLPTNAGPQWRPPWGTLSLAPPPPPFPPLSRSTASAGTITQNTLPWIIKSLHYFIFMKLCEILETITFFNFWIVDSIKCSHAWRTRWRPVPLTTVSYTTQPPRQPCFSVPKENKVPHYILTLNLSN